MKPTIAALTCLVSAWAMCPPAAAQAPKPAQDQPLLRGPEIPESATRTIVRHDAMGRFTRIEARPEEAALLQLDLDPGVRDAAQNIVVDRATRIGRMLVEQIDLLRESTDAQRAGNNDRVRAIMHEFHTEIDPDLQRSPLLEPLGSVLSATDHAALTRMVNDYWDAWIASEGGMRGDAMDRDPADDPRTTQIESRLNDALFQYEIGLAYQRTLRPVQERLERIYQATEPTDEQRAAIRSAVIDYVRETGLKADPARRLALARSLYEILDEERRVRLVAATIF